MGQIEENLKTLRDAANKTGTSLWHKYGPFVIVGAGLVVLTMTLAWVLFG